MTSRFALRAIALASTLVVAAAAQAAPAYKIKDLGTFGGPESDAMGLGHGRTVVGFSNTEGLSSHYRAFMYRDGHMKDLGGLSADGASFATGVNASGQASGYATAADFSTHAVVFEDGGLTDLAALRSDFIMSVANAVGASGHVAGSAVSSQDYSWHAFLYADGRFELLDTGTMANGLNDRDQMIGNADSQAAIFDHGQTTLLGALGGSFSEGSAINDAGEATGWASTKLDQFQHAFVWRSGKMHDLGSLGGWSSRGQAINRAGVVVGWSFTHLQSDMHAFVALHGRMMDLNSMLDPKSGKGWTLVSADGIDDRGRIVGTGVHDGYVHAFELTPAMH
jgi:probable HAF family extracellular repeat protein